MDSFQRILPQVVARTTATIEARVIEWGFSTAKKSAVGSACLTPNHYTRIAMMPMKNFPDVGRSCGNWELLSQEEVGRREMRHQSPAAIPEITSKHPRKSMYFPRKPPFDDLRTPFPMSVVRCGHGQRYMCLPCCSDHIGWSGSTVSSQSSPWCATPAWNEQSCNHFPSNNLGFAWKDAWKEVKTIL